MTTVFPLAVDGIVPEMPLRDAQVSTGAAGNTVHADAVSEFELRHCDSPRA